MAIITISRGSMSGGEALAERLAKKLGYPSVGREVIVAAAEKLGVSEQTLSEKFMRSPGLWERMTSNRRFYLVAVQAALVEHAARGDLIYHGHAGHLLLRGIPSVLRVRLIAPMDFRIRAVMERHQLDRDDAEAYIRRVDEERARWTKFIYGVDWTDPSLYDLVVSLEKMSMETASHMIAAAAGQPEYSTTDEVRKELANFLLASRVKMALASNPQTRHFELDVHAEDGELEITGILPAAYMLSVTSSRDEDEIRRTAEAVDGVASVRLSVQRIPTPH